MTPTPERQVFPDPRIHIADRAAEEFVKLIVSSRLPVTLREAAYDYIARQELDAKMRKLDREIREGLETGDRAGLDMAGEKEDEREMVRLRLALVLNQMDKRYHLDFAYKVAHDDFFPVWESAVGDSAEAEDILIAAEILKGVIKGNTPPADTLATT